MRAYGRIILLLIMMLGLNSPGIVTSVHADTIPVYAHIDEDAQTLMNILDTQGPDAYRAARESLSAKLAKEDPKYYLNWLNQIESNARVKYILAVAAKGMGLGEDNIGQQMYERLNAAVSANQISFDDLSNLYYEGPLPSHGLYFHDSQTIQLQILPPDQLYPVLIHELSHRFDPELQYGMGQFDQDGSKIENFLEKPLAQWNQDEKTFFGHYYFIKMLYLPYLKEIKPRMNACNAFTSLRLAGRLPNASADDLALYKQVLAHQIDCAEWVVSDFENTAREYHVAFQHYWTTQPELSALEDQAMTTWRQSIGVREFHVPYGYDP